MMENYIHKLVNKEIFSLLKEGENKETLWMISSFDDMLDDNKTWYNIYDYEYLQQTGEFKPYFTEGEKVEIVEYYSGSTPMLFVEDLHQKMQKQGFVWKH